MVVIIVVVLIRETNFDSMVLLSQDYTYLIYINMQHSRDV